MKSIILALAITMAAAATATPALAQDADAKVLALCGSVDSMVRVLKHKYQQEAIQGGTTSEGGKVVLFYSARQNTWTIVVINPNGLACARAEGTGWGSAVTHGPRG